MTIIPAAMTGGLFRVRAGIKPAIGGTVLGTLLRYIMYHGDFMMIVVIGTSGSEPRCCDFNADGICLCVLWYGT